MMQEIAVMKEGQKYNFRQDMKELFRSHLKEDLEVKIFRTIPDHYFWDIKKPLHPKPIIPSNRYNAFRGVEYRDFFDMRDSEEYLEEQEVHKNLNNAVSMHRRY